MSREQLGRLIDRAVPHLVAIINLSVAGKFAPILPVSWVVISAVCKKKKKKKVSKTGKLPFNYFNVLP